MTVIFELTLRQVMGKRALFVGLGVAALALSIAIIYRLSQHTDPGEFTAKLLLNGLFITTLAPLCALFFGTSVLGSDIEDGTDVFLLTKPMSRSTIVFAKLAAGIVAALVCVVPAAVVSAILAMGSDFDAGLVAGFAIAIAAAIGAYVALFMMLTILTNKALLIGLTYVFFWEGLLSSLLKGIKYFSIRQYALGLADSIARADPSVFKANLDGGLAIPLLIAVTAAIVVLAVKKLETFEVRGLG